MQAYSLLSRLLDYPTCELLDHVDQLRALATNDPTITKSECRAIEGVLTWMGGLELIPLQAAYVETFDLTPDHSLHLTHHLYGEDRERGPALVDLAEHYKEMGLSAMEGELPDYLPLILEYVSTLDPLQAQVFLGKAGEALEILAANLEKAESPYAPLVRICVIRGHLGRAAA